MAWSFLEWLEQTDLAIWVGESLYGYPFLLSMHAIGLAIVVGLAVLISLGQLKIIKVFSADLMFALIQIAWLGLAINVLSGLALFSSQATYFVTNIAFLIKMALIVAGAVSLAVIQRRVKNGGHGDRLVACASLLFWLGAIISGRLIAYL